MTRQEKYPDTQTFHYHNENPRNRITVDCVPRAIARGTGIDYNTVVMQLADLQVHTGYAEPYDRYLAFRGWVKRKQPRKDDNTKYTGKEFCRLLQKHLGRGISRAKGIDISDHIIAHIGGGHIVAIIDGKVNDIWDSTDGCIGNYWVKP